MSNKQRYGKTRLSDEHKMQLAQISASIITVAVGAAALATGTVNPLVIAGIAGATTTSAGNIYKFWKTKPDNDLCKRLADQIEKVENPNPDIINHDMIEGILSAAAKKIEEKATQNNLKPYRDDPDALFREIWKEIVHKDPNTLKAEEYYKDVLRVISSNIQIGDIEMQRYLLDMPKEILEGTESVIKNANQEQTEEIKQSQKETLQQQTELLMNLLETKTAKQSSFEKNATPKSDNEYYLKCFTKPLFLEEDEDEDDIKTGKKKQGNACIYVCFSAFRRKRGKHC